MDFQNLFSTKYILTPYIKTFTHFTDMCKKKLFFSSYQGIYKDEDPATSENLL